MSYSRFFLCDLQVHTPADRDHRYGNVGGPAPNEKFARQLIEAHKQAGVEVIAVTDHNRIDWYPVLRAVGEELGAYVFPGVEVSVNGCHLLLIWDRTEEGYRLAQQFLPTLWAPGEPPFDAPSGKPRPVSRGQVLDVAKNATDHHALVFAPHATKSRMGLFATHVCRNADEVAQSGLVLGFDVYGDNCANVLTNPNARFQGTFPRWFISGDVREFADVGQRATYLKLDAPPTLEGIRQAFISAETRVRFPETLKHEWGHVKGVAFLARPEPSWPRIDHLTVTGGFHEGLHLEFGPGLNAIIGGKGTGKSTLIEIIRYVLDAQPPTNSTAAELTGNRRTNFRANAEAEITYRSDEGEAYRVVRSGGDAPPQLFRDGTPVSAALVQKRTSIRVFGQRELHAYAQDRQLRREFVAWHAGSSWTDAITQEQLVLSKLEGIEALISSLETQVAQLDALETEFADLSERLDRARARGVEQLFARAESLTRTNMQIRAALGWPERMLESVERLKGVAVPEVPANAPNTDAWQAEFKTVEQFIRANTVEMTSRLSGLQPIAGQALQDWTTFMAAQQAAIERQLADAGFDDLRVLTETQRRAIDVERRIAALRTIQEQADRRVEDRAQLLQELEINRRHQSRLVELAARELTAKVGERVRVRVDPLADSSQIVNALATAVREAGSRVQRPQLERLAAHSPTKIAAAVRQGSLAIQQLGCTPATAAALAEIPPTAVRQIKQTAVTDVINIEINVGSSVQEQWIDIDHASPGQRATAMLALALSSGEEPLIIDQPEDDLDNRYIYEEVVKVLGRVCGERQVIIATHNANIPVLGDAEMILALDAVADRSAVLAAGGLEAPQVAYQVRHILEGGDEAFRARQNRYKAIQQP